MEASIAGVGGRISSAVSPDGRLAVMSSVRVLRELHIVDMATFEVVGAPLPAPEDCADPPLVQP